MNTGLKVDNLTEAMKKNAHSTPDQHMQKEGIRIVLGHDPVSWKDLKIAPDFYE